MTKVKKIAVLTAGGDAPGMSACVKAVVNRAIALGIEVKGVIGGYAGLLNNELVDLTNENVAIMVSKGGTFLYSSRCKEFETKEGMEKALATLREEKIDAVVCIGGDGTFRGATDLYRNGILTIGLPATIDNDITATDYTIGLDTAINSTVQMIDNLRDTCESHERLNVVEVMGHGCGQIALYAAIATGAVAVSIPELPFDEEAAIAHIADLRAKGKRGMIVIVSEGKTDPDGTPYAEGLEKRIKARTGLDTKFARLAHIVRGGSPTMKDRTFASEVAVKAVDLLVEGKSNLVMTEEDGDIVPVDIDLALAADEMYKNKLKPGRLDRFTPEQIERMKAYCEKRRAEIKRLQTLADSVAY